MSRELVFARHAQKEAQKLAARGQKARAQELLASIKENPRPTPTPYEKLSGDLAGAYSRRISIQHRRVSDVLVAQRAIKVLRMWSHHE